VVGVGVALYLARAHSLSAAEALALLTLELLAIGLAVGGALFGMALLQLPVSPAWLAAPLLAMGYGLDDVFVLLAAFSEARRAQVHTSLLAACVSCVCVPLCVCACAAAAVVCVCVCMRVRA
jgi:preprotein translocase subunit SecF